MADRSLTAVAIAIMMLGAGGVAAGPAGDPLEAFAEMARQARAERAALRFPDHKKLIAFSQDALLPEDLAKRSDEIAGWGLDGVVLEMKALKRGFSPDPVDEAALAVDYGALAGLKETKLTDNFVLCWATSTLDWFDEKEWAAALRNTRLIARGALLGQCAGILFDPECYGPNVWRWHGAKRFGKKTFAEYRARVERCGEEWMRAVEEELPAPRILALFLTGCEGLAYQSRKGADEVRKQQETAEKGMVFNYALLSAFMEGMIRAASPRAMIIDGNEPAYYFPYEGSHPTYASYFRDRAAGAFFPPEVARRYTGIVRLGSTFYPNFCLGLYEPKWSGADRLAPADQRRWLEHNVYWAFRTSQEYVWEYLDPPLTRWGGKLPDGYAEAVKRGRAKAETGAPLGFELPGHLAPLWTEWDKGGP
ncbi:MAG: hypothetical protein AAB152_09750 [Candidatus Coatesbacteria bacterium]